MVFFITSVSMKSERKKALRSTPSICDDFNHRHMIYILIPPRGMLNLISYSGPDISAPTTSSTSHT